jgi:SAM-dependent methyltransferase
MPERINLPPRTFGLTAWLFYDPSLQASIRKILAPASDLRFLDAACGTGTLSHLTNPAQLFGFDMERSRVRQAAHATPNAGFVVANAQAQPWPNGAFDRILSAGLFHHVDSIKASVIFDEFIRVLAPSGWIVYFDAIWPKNPWNLPALLARRLDRGAYVRTAEESLELLAQKFRIGEPQFPSRLGLEYLLVKLLPLDNR